MKTLVLSQRYTDDSNLLWRAAIDAGWEVARARGLRAPPVAGEPVLYGETIFADAVAEELGVSVLGPPDAWLPSLPARFLQRRVALEALGEALASGAFPRFVKPPDDKLFPARVYRDADDLRSATPGFDEAAPVLTSDPARFIVEYRVFVAERAAAAASVYIRGGAIAAGWEERDGEREGALAFLSELLADTTIEMPPALVIDVGLLSTGAWAVVEGNPAWASGVCGCDPALVLPVLAAATAPKSAGSRWARGAVWTSEAS